jgi:hypothetical protein
MRVASVGVGNFSNDLRAIFHGQKHGFIVHAIRILFDTHAGFRPYGFCGSTSQLVDVEADMALGHLMCFIADKATSSEIEKVIIVMQA